MSKLFSIAVVLLTAVAVAAPAQAQDPTTGERIIAQERAQGLLPPTPQAEAPTHSILAQEHSRRWDARLFQPSGPAPILVAGPRDRFDLADAGIGSAAALVVAFLGAAAFVFRSGSRRERTS